MRKLIITVLEPCHDDDGRAVWQQSSGSAVRFQQALTRVTHYKCFVTIFILIVQFFVYIIIFLKHFVVRGCTVPTKLCRLAIYSKLDTLRSILLSTIEIYLYLIVNLMKKIIKSRLVNSKNVFKTTSVSVPTNQL